MTTSRKGKPAKIMGTVLRQWREQAGFNRTQLEVATTGTINQYALSNYERGDAMVPVEKLLPLARQLGIKPFEALATWLKCNLADSFEQYRGDLGLVSEEESNWWQGLGEGMAKLSAPRLQEGGFDPTKSTEIRPQNTWEQRLLTMIRWRLMLSLGERISYEFYMEKILRQVATIGDDALKAWELTAAQQPKTQSKGRGKIGKSRGGSRSSYFIQGYSVLAPDLKYELGRFAESIPKLVDLGVEIRYLLPASRDLITTWGDLHERLSADAKMSGKGHGAVKLKIPEARAMPLEPFYSLTNDLRAHAGLCIYSTTGPTLGSDDSGGAAPRVAVRYNVEGGLNVLVPPEEVAELARKYDEAWENQGVPING